jgi:hypothetical protein
MIGTVLARGSCWQDMQSRSGSFLQCTRLRSAPRTRRCRRSLFARSSFPPPGSSQGISCSSGCPPATTARADMTSTSHCRSPRNARSIDPPSSLSTPCVRADCCTCPDHRSGRWTRLLHVHTRFCNSRTPGPRSPPPTSRSPGTAGTRPSLCHRLLWSTFQLHSRCTPHCPC